MTHRRTTTIGFGIVLVVIGLLLLWGGLTPLSQHRDVDGYLLSDELRIDQPSHAVVATDVDLLRGHYDCAAEETLVLDFFSPDDVRMVGIATGAEPLFMGIAPADDVDRYLERVAHEEITDWDCDVDDIEPIEYTSRSGTDAPAPPGSERIWVASVSGRGEQRLDWTIEDGDWAIVIMNADASPGVSADVRFGGLAPSQLDALAWTSIAAGLVALISGGWLLYLARRRGRTAPNEHVLQSVTTEPERGGGDATS